MAPDDMPRIDLDPQAAERLIAGRAGDPADLPRGAAEASYVLDAARRATTERDDSRMAATVAAMRNVLVPEGATSPAVARRLALSPLPKVLAAGAAGLTVLFGGLAAAGALPAGAQNPVADLVSHVGIELPHADSPAKPAENPTAAPTTSTSTTSTTIPVIVGVPPTEAPTSETTVTAPACPPPSHEGTNGCVTPLPVPEPPTTTKPTPTTSTTTPPPPPTTTTSTTVPAGAGQTGGRRGDVP
jgi:hypothetical protein